MTVDELRALVIECAGESVVREAEAVDQVQTHTVLANLVADWNAGKDFDPGVYDFLLGRIVLRDDDSPRQFGMLKQQAVSELQAIVIRTWLTDMSRGVAATVCKALAGLGYGAHISKKDLRLHRWTSLRHGTTSIRMSRRWISSGVECRAPRVRGLFQYSQPEVERPDQHAVVTVVFLQFFRAPAFQRPAAIAVADSFRQLHDFLLPAVRVHRARGYYGLTAKLTVWH